MSVGGLVQKAADSAKTSIGLVFIRAGSSRENSIGFKWLIAADLW